MRFISLCFALLSVTVSALPCARAATIVSDNFDSYADQDAFEDTWIPIATVAPQSAELSNLQSVSPSQSVRVPGTTANNQSRNRRTFAETNTFTTGGGNLPIGDQIVWSFDMWDSFPSAATDPHRAFANLQDTTNPTLPNQLLSIGLNNNQVATASGGNYYMARILGFAHSAVDPEGGPAESSAGTSTSSFFKLNDPGAPLRSAGWHNFKVVISTDDGLSADFKFYVDNILAETVNNVGNAAAFRSYDNITVGPGNANANQQSFYDNMLLEVITPGVIPNVDSLLIDNVNASDPGLVEGAVTQTGGTSPITWGGFDFVSFTPSHGATVAQGEAEADGIATFNPADQKFSWNTVGAPRGTYVWTVSATNSAGSNSDTITVNIVEVPEPATFALVGLALAGVVLGARRRDGCRPVPPEN